MSSAAARFTSVQHGMERGWRRLGAQAIGVGMLVLLSLIVGNGSQYLTFTIEMIAIYVIAATGLNIAIGLTGQFQMAQAGFMGIAAYTTAILVNQHHTPELLAVLAGIGLATVSGLIAAIIIILVGIVLGGFVGGLIAASVGALTGGRMLARAGRGGVILLALFMAVQELGIATDIITTAFAILFGAVALALALAFGLGNRELAAEVTREWYERYRMERDEVRERDRQAEAAEEAALDREEAESGGAVTG